MLEDPCPCFSQKSYRRCCRPYHIGEILPELPQQLMRARFAAYALGKCDFIYDSSSKSLLAREGLNPADFKGSVKAFSESTDFIGLEIIEAEGDLVTFIARLKDKTSGQDMSFKEKSYFIKEGEKWVYDSGEPSRLA